MIDYDKGPFATGTFKNVWLGRYNNGTRKGETCIAKEFKNGSVYENYYFDEEMKVVEMTKMIVGRFNDAGILGGRQVRVNIPDIATGRSREIRGVKALIEPYIEKFEKFNSNSGWVHPTAGEWGDAMQALSHFSYHYSNGRYLLCDLQGGIYRDGL
jgi:hypothetical protein